MFPQATHFVAIANVQLYQYITLNLRNRRN